MYFMAKGWWTLTEQEIAAGWRAIGKRRTDGSEIYIKHLQGRPGRIYIYDGYAVREYLDGQHRSLEQLLEKYMTWRTK
jgi:hypothetical protein